MKEQKINRSRLLQIRLTPDEWKRIHDKFSKSIDRKMSEYVRKLLLDKKITVNVRNQSFDDFMSEMVLLRRELNAIGTNYNQVVKRLHMLEDIYQFKNWTLMHISNTKILVEKIIEIKSKINQINDQWLQS